VATIIFPRIHFQALSPKMTLSLGSFLLSQGSSARGGFVWNDADATDDPAGKAPSPSPRQSVAGSSSSSRKRDPCLQCLHKERQILLFPPCLQGKPVLLLSRQEPTGCLAAEGRGEHGCRQPAELPRFQRRRSSQGSSDRENAEQVMRTSPHATALSFMALTKALVGYAEERMVRSGCVSRNKSYNTVLTGMACRPPRKLSEAPYSLHLDIPRERCAAWVPSATYIAASSLTFVGGK